LNVVGIGDLQLIQWIGYGLQMPVRQMQVDESVFKAGMTEQELDGTEVGSGFEPVSGAAVPQAMRRKAFGDASGG